MNPVRDTKIQVLSGKTNIEEIYIVSNGMKRILFIILFLGFFSPIFLVQARTPIKILIVPGHDNEVWGSQYGNTKEADMTLALGARIFNLLKKDKNFEVHITRDSLGYTTEFADYFLTSQADIVAFRKNAKLLRENNIQNGTFIKKENTVPHNMVSESVAMNLYGINKWANDNKMDFVLHIHFNDYPRPNKWTKGKYKGFSIYMPDEQMVNSGESVKLAQNIFTELKKKYAVSTYEKEQGGLIPDQSLIALGSNGTLDASVRSVLVEYGYIYRFGNSNMRRSSYTSMAQLTVQGIKNYFFK